MKRNFIVLILVALSLNLVGCEDEVEEEIPMLVAWQVQSAVQPKFPEFKLKCVSHSFIEVKDNTRYEGMTDCYATHKLTGEQALYRTNFHVNRDGDDWHFQNTGGRFVD